MERSASRYSTPYDVGIYRSWGNTLLTRSSRIATSIMPLQYRLQTPCNLAIYSTLRLFFSTHPPANHRPAPAHTPPSPRANFFLFSFPFSLLFSSSDDKRPRELSAQRTDFFLYPIESVILVLFQSRDEIFCRLFEGGCFAFTRGGLLWFFRGNIFFFFYPRSLT